MRLRSLSFLTLTSLCLAVLGSSCAERDSGTGIGRPRYRPELPSARPTITIAGILATSTDSNFVELTNTGSDDVDTTDMTLQTGGAVVAVPSGLLPAGGSQRVSVSQGFLGTHAGEVALFDAAGAIAAYFAWGTNPSVWTSGFSGLALLAGLPHDFVSIGFPMPADVGVAQVGENAGCADASGESFVANDIDSGLCPNASVQLQISEVAPTAFNDPSWVDLYNASNEPLSLSGVRLCQPPTCITFGFDEIIEAQSYKHVELPVSSAGEVVLLAPGAAGIIDYVRFGDSFAQFAAAAVEKGVWDDAAAFVLPPRIVGETLGRNPALPVGSGAWFPMQPTPSADNADIRESTDLWQSCSYPRFWNPAATPELVITKVSSAAIEVTTASDNLAFGDYKLQLLNSGGTEQEYLFESTAVGPLVITLRLGCSDADCWDVTLGAAFELALLYDTDPSGTRDFHIAQYLTVGEVANPAWETDAVEANVWPKDNCPISALQSTQTLELIAGSSAQSPADYAVQSE